MSVRLAYDSRLCSRETSTNFRSWLSSSVNSSQKNAIRQIANLSLEQYYRNKLRSQLVFNLSSVNNSQKTILLRQQQHVFKNSFTTTNGWPTKSCCVSTLPTADRWMDYCRNQCCRFTPRVIDFESDIFVEERSLANVFQVPFRVRVDREWGDERRSYKWIFTETRIKQRS